MTHRKTTTVGSQETQTCERGMTMGSGRICFGKLGDHPVVDFAVQELVRYLKQMDAELSVTVFQADGITQSPSGIIWVGMDPELRHAVPEVADPSVDDAIAISAENGTGYITGTNERCVLLAAYRFLKELGCAWVRPGPEGERIPKKKIAAHRIHVREKADYRHRGVCMEGAISYEHAANMVDFLPKIGMNAYFMQFHKLFCFCNS